MAKLTRARLECVAEDAQKASLFLVGIAGQIKTEFGGEWEEEAPGVSTMSTSYDDKVWGRLTIRRKEDAKAQ